MGGINLKNSDRNKRLEFLEKVINTNSSLLGDINTKNTVKYDANQAFEKKKKMNKTYILLQIMKI